MPRPPSILLASFVTLLLMTTGCSKQPSTVASPARSSSASGNTASDEATAGKANAQHGVAAAGSTAAAVGSAGGDLAGEAASRAATQQAASPERLVVGSVAPQLELAHWVQGEEVTQFQPGHTYVVEFWATWCGPCRDGMPHLARLQEEYQGKVTFIGVTGEDEATVASFLNKTRSAENEQTWGDVVTYALALDDNRATSAAYMRAAGQNGIPAAFVVGPDAHIEWIGHPARIDEPLEQIVSGTWNRDEYLARYQEQQRKELAMRATLMALQRAQQDGDWEQAIASIDDLIAQNPEERGFEVFKLSLLIRAGRIDEATALAERVAKDNWDNADQLNAIAWSLATQSSNAEQRLPVALRLAKRASELYQDKDPSTIDTLARVYFEQGNLDEAIAWQEKAVELGGEIEGLQETLQKYLLKRDGESGPSQSEGDESKSDP